MKTIIRFTVVVVGLFLVWRVIAYYTYDFSHDGDMVYELNPIMSPDNRFEANVYFDNYGGAVGGTNLIVKVRDLSEGIAADERTVYFGDGQSTWLVQWLDRDILHVKNESDEQNLSAKLVVDEEVYDQHGVACNLYKVKTMYRCKQMEG